MFSHLSLAFTYRNIVWSFSPPGTLVYASELRVYGFAASRLRGDVLPTILDADWILLLLIGGFFLYFSLFFNYVWNKQPNGWTRIENRNWNKNHNHVVAHRYPHIKYTPDLRLIDFREKMSRNLTSDSGYLAIRVRQYLMTRRRYLNCLFISLGTDCSICSASAQKFPQLKCSRESWRLPLKLKLFSRSSSGTVQHLHRHLPFRCNTVTVRNATMTGWMSNKFKRENVLSFVQTKTMNCIKI